MATGDIAQRSNGLGDIQSILNIFKGPGATTQNSSNTSNSSETVSNEKATAYLKQILESTSGLASVSSGQKAAGMYGSTVNQQLTNDLLSRTAAQTAALSSNKTTTSNTSTTGKTAPQMDLGKTLMGLAAGQVLTPVAKAGSKKLGLDKLGDNIADTFFGSPALSTTPANIEVVNPATSVPIDTGALSDMSWADSMVSSDGSFDASSGSGGMDAGTAMAATAGATAIGASLAADAGLTAGGYVVGAETAAWGTAAATAGTAAEGAGILETLGTVAVAMWIICTELNKQDRLPTRWYVYGAKEFLSYDEQGKQGYYIWAIPSVKHLRKHPNSMYSKLMEVVFNARAEYLAAKAGCKGARKTALGFLTTHGLYAFCWTLSRTIARKSYTKEYILNLGA